MTESFEHTIHYILTEGPEIHKTYSIELGFCYLTDRKGKRHKVTSETGFEQVMQLLTQIKKANETIYA